MESAANLRDLTADWLSEVCYDVAIEPPLQQLTGEIIIPLTVNRQDKASADILQGDFRGDDRVPFLMLGFFTRMHLVIAIQPSQPSIGTTSRRRGNMVIIFERLRRFLLLPYSTFTLS